MAYILDFAVILILLLSIFTGKKRGFVRTLITMAGCLLALTVAGLCCKPAATAVYNGFFRERLVTSLETRIHDTADLETLHQKVADIVDELPGSVTSWIDAELRQKMETAVTTERNAGTRRVAEIAEETVVGPLAVNLLTILCFFIFFVILLLLTGIFARMANAIFELPVLHTFNALGGAALGAARGVVLMIAFSLLFWAVAACSEGGFISMEAVDNSLLVSRIISFVRGQGILNGLFKMIPG